MGDTFYRAVCAICRPPFSLSSRPIELHVNRVPATGAIILAPNHTSPFDIPCLMRSTPRPIDFLSIVEMKRKRLIGPLYRAMNCVFVDRARSDVAAVRALRLRLEQQRVIAMFPEGHIRKPENAVTHGGAFKPGVIKLAHQSETPIVPCVMINTAAYQRPLNWLPFRRWAYGINYGEPIRVRDLQAGTVELKAAYRQLFDELLAALHAHGFDSA